MKQNFEDNTVFVLQQILRKLKLKVSEETIKNFLLAHPYYPTLKSVCDVLKKWKIEYYPLKLELEEIESLEMPFIAHFYQSGGQLVFVEGINGGKVKYLLQKGKKEVEDFEKFAEKLSGVVVVIEPEQKVKDPNYRQNWQNEVIRYSFLPLSIITILLFILLCIFVSMNGSIHMEGFFPALVITKLLGVTASLFLVLHELKIRTPLGDKLCGFSSKTDCNTVLNSNASHLFGSVDWADAGLIYFTGTFIFLSGTVGIPSLGLLAILSVIALPYPIFSVYYQAFKLKKWCPFCLLVQLILVSEFFILLPVFRQVVFSIIDILRLIFSFLLPAIIWIFFKMNHSKSQRQEQEHYLFLKLKRNPELFKFLLKNDRYIEIHESSDSLILGDPDAPITMTAFLSLYCGPCAQVFRKLKLLLENCPEIKINAIFLVYKDEETQQVVNAFYYLYATKGTDAVLDFLDQWYSQSSKLIKRELFSFLVPEKHRVAERLSVRNNQLFEKYQIAGTPTVFLNGYKFPDQYEYGDLEYYIEDIRS